MAIDDLCLLLKSPDIVSTTQAINRRFRGIFVPPEPAHNLNFPSGPSASNDYPEYSAGAIFHTGSLHLRNTSFTANAAGAEGTAVFSIGALGELMNVTFSHNYNICRIGQYGYIVENDVSLA